MDPIKKALENMIKATKGAIDKGEECLCRGCAEQGHYCKNSDFARDKIQCPYLSKEMVYTIDEKVSKAREDYILKKTKVKPEKSRNEPVAMVEKNKCMYVPKK